MNEKFNKNATVEKLTKKVGRGVRFIVIGPSFVNPSSPGDLFDFRFITASVHSSKEGNLSQKVFLRHSISFHYLLSVSSCQYHCHLYFWTYISSHKN